ncbi:MAG: hypothetical protein LBE36_00640 [Flavobacteriaceae bacterium]|jgi:hypothetical protein|nr:hypothetical protein [Flavobacteriaceae bacterium]
MELDKNGIATGATKEDYLMRKKFISDFYARWIAANISKHIFLLNFFIISVYNFTNGI